MGLLARNLWLVAYAGLAFTAILFVSTVWACLKHRIVTSVAMRYITRRAITWVAALLIAFNVLLYLLCISVLEGFKEHYMDKLQSIMAHATVDVGNLAWGIQKPEEWSAEIAKVDPGIRGVTVGLESPAMAIFNNARTVGTMRGIDLQRELEVGRLKELLKPAELRDTLKEFGTREVQGKSFQSCIVGGAWRKNYNLKVGDQVTFIFSNDEGEPRTEAFVIIGFFEGSNPYAEAAAYVDRIHLAKKLGVPGMAKSLFIWMHEPNRADLLEVRDKIGSRMSELVGKVNPGNAKLIEIETWQQKDNNAYEAITRENIIFRFIMTISLVLIAFIVFLIFGRLVAEKLRDIGALRAMGATPAVIRGAFLAQGLFVSLFGLGLGLTLSYVFINKINPIANFFGIDPFPEGAFGVSRIPVHTLPQDVWMISAFTIGFALLGTFIPAWRAARMNPVECLRRE